MPPRNFGGDSFAAIPRSKFPDRNFAGLPGVGQFASGEPPGIGPGCSARAPELCSPFLPDTLSETADGDAEKRGAAGL